MTQFKTQQEIWEWLSGDPTGDAAVKHIHSDSKWYFDNGWLRHTGEDPVGINTIFACPEKWEGYLRSYELKPCPFCNSNDIKLVESNSVWACCAFCNAEGPNTKTRKEACKAWNSRI